MVSEQFKGQARLPGFAIPKRYDLTLQPDLIHCTFSGSVEITVDVVAETRSIVLNAADLTFDGDGPVSFRISNSSQELRPSELVHIPEDEILVLGFDDYLPLGVGVLAIRFYGTLNDQMKGFYRSSYDLNGEKKNMAVTQFEPADARRCFPCWDEPAFKATFKITLVVPSELVALSCMPVTEEKINGPLKAVFYKESPIMSAYLVAVVVGMFDYVEGISPDGTKVRVYTQGVLEAIRISCAGYPTRKTFYEFIHRFGLLAPEFLDGNLDDLVTCQNILDKIGLKGYQIGKYKVFLRAGQMADLDARRAEVLGKAARIIQKYIRSHSVRRHLSKLRKAVMELQSSWRGRLARELYLSMRRSAAAVKIQKNLRRHISIKSYKKLQSSAITLQSGLRKMSACNDFRFKKQTKAAIIIQSKWRFHVKYSFYKNLQDAAITYQCAWRQRNARMEIKKLRAASRESGALKEAKDKLEKRVEELTWRLQLEKIQRTELEDAKTQEVGRLQEALHSMQLQIEEANSMVNRERVAARKAIQEAPPIIKETPVFVENTEKINLLTPEIENLKELLLQEKNRTNEIHQAFQDSVDKNKKLEQKVILLQEIIQSLKGKATNLESENQVLRQKTLTMTPSGMGVTPHHKSAIIHKKHENEDGRIKEERMTLPSTAPLSDKKDSETEEKPQKTLNEKQRENQEMLIKCISQNLGFNNGVSIVACLIFKCLQHWRSFEVEKTSIFDRIIQTINSDIEGQENNNVLSYWLQNLSTLFFLLQRTLKTSGTANMSPHGHRRRSTSLFGRKTLGPPNAGRSYLSDHMNGVRQVQAKYPALLFKQQLTALLEKIYGMLRDNLKREISSLLGLCIQTPRTSHATLVKGAHFKVATEARLILIAHWHSIVKILNNYLKIMKANFVPPYLVCKVFTQIFSFINVQLFNSLLLRRECCSFRNPCRRTRVQVTDRKKENLFAKHHRRKSMITTAGNR